MNYEMKIARMLADHIKLFVEFVYQKHENNNRFSATDKLYQLKLLVEEFQLQMLSDELMRINLHTWDEKYTYLLVGRFRKGLSVLDEYVETHYDELYIFTAKLYTLKNLSSSFKRDH